MNAYLQHCCILLGCLPCEVVAQLVPSVLCGNLNTYSNTHGWQKQLADGQRSRACTRPGPVPGGRVGTHRTLRELKPWTNSTWQVVPYKRTQPPCLQRGAGVNSLSTAGDDLWQWHPLPGWPRHSLSHTKGCVHSRWELITRLGWPQQLPHSPTSGAASAE